MDSPKRPLTLIVPLYKRENAFMRFVKLYNRLLITHDNLNLIVAIAGDDIDRQNIVEIIEDKIPQTFVNSHVRVKTCKLPFDKAHCLQGTVLYISK